VQRPRAVRLLKNHFRRYERVQGVTRHSDHQNFGLLLQNGHGVVLPNKAEKDPAWFWPDFRRGNECPQTASYEEKICSLWKIMAFSTFPRMTSTREHCQKCDFHVSAATDDFLSPLGFFSYMYK
jgi:hypothetical protein